MKKVTFLSSITLPPGLPLTRDNRRIGRVLSGSQQGDAYVITAEVEDDSSFEDALRGKVVPSMSMRTDYDVRRLGHNRNN
jgi:hypothetical protein